MKRRVAKREKVPETVTYTQSFAAVVRIGDNSIKKLVIKAVRWYQHQLNKFKDGEEVSLVVHNRKPKRTEQQNRYYWGVYLPLIAKESGDEDRNKDYIEILHERFKGEFLNRGLFEAYGKKVWLKKSSTELSVSEFCDYIMDIEKLTGVVAPPTENYGLAPLKNENLLDTGEE